MIHILQYICIFIFSVYWRSYTNCYVLSIVKGYTPACLGGQTKQEQEAKTKTLERSIKRRSLFFLLLIDLFLLIAGGGPSLIDWTCRNVSERDPEMSYELCKTFVQAAPASGCADLLEHGVHGRQVIPGQRHLHPMPHPATARTAGVGPICEDSFEALRVRTCIRMHSISWQTPCKSTRPEVRKR